jgi:hypothetical protein
VPAGALARWLGRLRLACRSKASNNPNAISTTAQGKTAAVISAAFDGIVSAATCMTLVAASAASNRTKHSHP